MPDFLKLEAKNDFDKCRKRHQTEVYNIVNALLSVHYHRNVVFLFAVLYPQENLSKIEYLEYCINHS